MNRKSGPGRSGLRGLIVAPYGILPAQEGNKAHTEVHIRQLKSLGHDIWYLGLGLPPAEAAAMERGWGERFVHAPFLPWHRRKPFGQTLWNFLRKRARERLGQQPHVDTWYQDQWTEAASELAGRVPFDYVLVHYVFLTRVLGVFPSSVRKIIDTHDSFANRFERLAAQGVSARWWTCSSRGEVMALQRGDYVMANQPDDAETFKNRLGAGGKVVTVGHPGDWQPLPEAATSCIGFLGSGNPMNQAGLSWFIEKCWPLIRSGFPDAQFLLAGPICGIPGPWSGAAGVKMLGPVASIRDFHELTTIEINPVSAGSGLKIKTIESLASGRALVSVSEGVAGLSRDYGAFIVADTAAAFAAAAIGLLQDRSARAALVARAERLIADWNNRQRSALASLFDGL